MPCALPAALLLFAGRLARRACQARAAKGAGRWTAFATGAPSAPRLSAAVWLLLALVLEDPAERLVASVFLASLRDLPAAEAAAGLAAAAARELALAPSEGVGRSISRSLSRGEASLEVPRTLSAVIKKHPNWVPPKDKETTVFQQAFELDDYLLAVEPCAVSLRVTHQGHLYVSRRHIGFQGVAIGGIHGLQFCAPLDELTAVERGGDRASATLVFSSAIEVRGSILAGQKDHRARIALVGNDDAFALLAAIAARRAGPSDGDQDDDGPDGQDLAAAPSESSLSSAAMSAFEDGEPFTGVLEAQVPRLPMAALHADLASDSLGPDAFLVRYFGSVGASDVVPAAWIAVGPPGASSDGVARMRELKFQARVPPAPMCPKTTRVTATLLLVTGAGGGEAGFTLMSSKISHDVPFGDKFLVQEKFELEASGNGRASVRISARVIFLQSCGMLQSRIRSSTLAQLRKAAESFLTLLRASIDHEPTGGQADARQDDTRGATRTEHVLEVQRRATLWSAWQAPFLPHEGSKKWRWVDTGYQLHPLRSPGSRLESAAADSPPLETPDGWAPISPWEVRKSEETDADGWQYAVDFYTSSAYWGVSCYGLHVRRRLWARGFELEGTR